ncbi:hypothetical protein FSP39_007032 [Pinctada imbricata]|uniref:C3H1-type domain-containing protein n=1 Tax=Pinctada imbricata TaxID=66713 RepID=A0AA88YLA2_PINIB|nr:hypothetical protein FSP39_007032 [Pinctada imbricata]
MNTQQTSSASTGLHAPAANVTTTNTNTSVTANATSSTNTCAAANSTASTSVNTSATEQGNRDNTLNVTGPLHSGRSLSQGVDLKINSKIWAEEYLDLGQLLFKSKIAKLQAVQGEDNSISFVQKEEKSYFKSMQQWTTAFHVFVAIYCEKIPMESPGLMKYMATIQKLSEDVGTKAALHYDEQFRLWRSENPNIMPWGKLNQELHSEALQMGLKSRLNADPTLKKQNQLFRAQQSKKGVCFSWNNNAGKCLRPNCNFQHVCRNCHGPHPRKLCKASSDTQKSNVQQRSKSEPASAKNDKSK